MNRAIPWCRRVLKPQALVNLRSSTIAALIDKGWPVGQGVLVNLRALSRLPMFLALLALSCDFPILNAQPFWPRFRGPNGQGVAESAHPPITFSQAENAVWSAEVAPGHSSPCVWGKSIFLSTFQEGGLQCRAYDRDTGKLRWSREVPASKIERTHDFSNPAAPTPAADKQ